MQGKSNAELRPRDEDGDGDSSSSASSSSVSSAGTVVPSLPSHAVASSASWSSCFAQELFLEATTATYHVYVTPPRDTVKGPLFVCHHGAGSSGLSFALFAAHLRHVLPSAGVISIDARGHGLTSEKEASSSIPDFSLATLSNDLIQMIRSTQTKLSWPGIPPLVLVGHSLGGVVVTDVAKSGIFGAGLIGYAVLDVVEGSAMEALKSMSTLLAARPSSFDSLGSAVDWHIRSRTIRNPSSAKISTAGLVTETSPGRWTWRTDLATTESFWENWFTGMSKSFLAGKAAKLLILAGTDRLDKDLMIGQMQGKFQLQVFPEAGHYVQEDLPERTADLVAEFYKRNDRSALVLPPKVSDLLKQGKKV